MRLKPGVYVCDFEIIGAEKVVRTGQQRARKPPPSTTSLCGFCQRGPDSTLGGWVPVDTSGVKHRKRDRGEQVVHRNCAEWAPKAFYVNSRLVGVADEIRRASRLTYVSRVVEFFVLFCFEK